MEVAAQQQNQPAEAKEEAVSFRGPTKVPAIGDESFLFAFFSNLTGSSQMAESLMVASAMFTQEVDRLGLSLMRCFALKGQTSFTEFLDRRGRRPLRSMLYESMTEEFGDDDEEEQRNGRDGVASFFSRDVAVEQWTRLFVNPNEDSFPTFRRRLSRAAMAAVVAICNQKLPVRREVVDRLKQAKELTRNVSFTVVTAVAELLWKHSTPLATAVHKDLVAQVIMLLSLALMKKFGDELSLRIMRASVKDLSVDVMSYCAR